MKVRRLTLQGFRGFNDEQSIDFHERLTLIYAPNSYGKTSISEAFEWLLYGVTSKVEKADSKDEYKGSYRNRHLPQSLPAFVQVHFYEGGNEMILTGELADDDSIRRFVGEGTARVEVDEWPIRQDLHVVPRPFILQHALKYLLLVKPDERFQGFARLLGFEDLDQIHRNIIALCTAPERKIPSDVAELRQRIAVLEARIASRPTLSSVQKAFRKKDATTEDIYRVITAECRRRVPAETEEGSLLPQLLKIREETVGKVFRGRIELPSYSATEAQSNSEDAKYFLNCLTEVLAREYTELAALSNIEHVLKKAQFFNLGISFLSESQGKCAVRP